METTLVWTGAVTIGGLLMVPVLLEFFKRNMPVCFGLATTLLTIYCLAPYSAGAREVWTPISKIPADLAQIVNGFMAAPSERTLPSPSPNQ